MISLLKYGMKAKGYILGKVRMERERRRERERERENEGHPSGDTKAVGYVSLQLRLEIPMLKRQTRESSTHS